MPCFGLIRYFGLLGAVLSGAALAEGEPEQAHASWTTRAWQTDDGLPDNRVTGLAQTPDGYLWVATRGGLVRFNGSAFERFDLSDLKGVIGNGLPAMYSDTRGTLWLGAYRETLVRVGTGSAQVFTAANGVPAGAFFGFAEERSGRCFLAFGSRIYRVEDAKLIEVRGLGAADPGARASLASDGRGTVWCSRGGSVGVVHGGVLEPRFQIDSREVLLAPARNGDVWACGGPRIVRVGEDALPSEYANLPADAHPISFVEDTSGALWVGTSAQGLFRCVGRTVEKIETSHLNIDSLLEDREGNIWAATFGGGLDLIRPRTIELIGPKSGLPFDSVVSVCQDSKGALWVAGAAGGLARGDGTNWDLIPAGGGGATCVAADRQGRVWVGTNQQGLREVVGRDQPVRSWIEADGLPSNSIRALLVASDDSLWFATNNPACLCQLSHGSVRTIPAPGSVRNIRVLAQDARGTVWIGTSDGQVLKESGGKLMGDAAFAGEPSSSIRSLQATPDGCLWIGYAAGGIGLYQSGRFTRLSVEEGLADESTWQMAADRSGSLWLAGVHGLSRVSRDEAIQVSRGLRSGFRSVLYGHNEGVPNLQPRYGNSPAVCQSRDGRIFFSTSLGLLVVNPQSLRDSSLLPPVMLERVLLDGKPVAIGSGRFPLRSQEERRLYDLGSPKGRLSLPPDNRRLDFDFAALSYSAPENVRFRYRLDGFDDQWSEAGSERSAHYSRLPAGNYAFHVIASNNSGVWNETGATVGITVSPFVWQTWWFRIGLLVTFTAGVVAVVRFVSFQRLQAQLRLSEQQAALFEERTRIARDIHDDIGGSLAHVKLLSELAVHDPSVGNAAADQMRQITGATRHILKSLDETIWAINPRNDTLPNLIDYLGQYAVEFLRAANIRCELELPDHPPEVPVASDVRHHVYLVVKEALTNVVRHSGARVVRMRAIVEKGALSVSIQDDGRGHDGRSGDAHEDGIRNMRQRMTMAGGKFDFESGLGAGTRIGLTVPIESGASPVIHSSDDA